MKVYTKALCLCAAILLSACGGGSDSAWKAEQRASLISKVFPNPADQQGLFLVYPLESGGVYKTMEVVWYPQEVSRAEVVQRVGRFCKTQRPEFARVGVKRNNERRTLTLHTGETKIADGAWFECLPAS